VRRCPQRLLVAVISAGDALVLLGSGEDRRSVPDTVVEQR